MLLSKTNFLDRIQILSNFFLENLKNQRFGDPMVLNAALQIKNSNNNVNVKNLAKNYCLSQKQFERRFKVGTGFNPKLYARIIRFEKLMKNHATFKNFTQAAYSTGYYDQSHLIRDFKDFTGYDPYQFIEICGY
jgi:methylphosphotriester-DNA--protein-cysteine methyltransferase